MISLIVNQETLEPTSTKTMSYTFEDIREDHTITAVFKEDEEPVDPDQPTDPDTPTDPDKPTNPDTPTDPDKPTDPDTPEDPDMPSKPDKPSKPSKPMLPSTGDIQLFVAGAIAIAAISILGAGIRKAHKQ